MKVALSTLSKLSKLRTKYGPTSENLKFHGIKTLQSLELKSPKLLRQYHDLLLFWEAFPDSKRVYQLVRSELKRVAGLAGLLVAKSKAARRELSKGSISGSTIQNSLSLSASHWISNLALNNYNIDFYSTEDLEPLESFIRDSTQTLLSDAILDPDLSTEKFVQLLSAKSGALWLFKLFSENNSPVAERCFESLNLWFNWKLDYSSSITGNRFPKRPIYLHHSELRSRESITQIIRKTLPKKTKVSSAKVIKPARLSLFTRGRETDPLVYCDRSSLSLYRLERGVDVALFGCIPERRRALETFIGYVAAKNRVPWAYGGAWIFGKRADIGVNVFDQFRGGDSFSLFAQLLRVYHQRYGIEVFEVEPYQFGTSEGIRTGAFWFYWKLGFRPIKSKLVAVAEKQWEKLSQKDSYRVPRNILQRLSKDKLRLTITPGMLLPPPSVKLGTAALKFAFENFDGDLISCEESKARLLLRWLAPTMRRTLTPDELTAFKRVAPLLTHSQEIRRWTKKDKSKLYTLLTGKGAKGEEAFTKALAASPALIHTLTQIVDKT